MRQPYLQLHVHLVWSTWDREPSLTAGLLDAVHNAIAANAVRLGCHPVHVGGTSDHVHVLVGLPATMAVSTLVQHLKGSSSHLVNHVLSPGLGFRWQGAYGAFAVDRHSVARCRDYVAQQSIHHGDGDLDPDWETTHCPSPAQAGLC